MDVKLLASYFLSSQRIWENNCVDVKNRFYGYVKFNNFMLNWEIRIDKCRINFQLKNWESTISPFSYLDLNLGGVYLSACHMIVYLDKISIISRFLILGL